MLVKYQAFQNKFNYSSRFFNSNSKLYIWLSNNTNIYSNLAFESSLSESTPTEEQHLFLWRNQKTVILGRHQNPWLECNLENIKNDNVLLSRRYSGGGTVYQDLGNLCFTFLSNKKHFDIKRNNSIILNSLKKNFDILGEVSGRNDLTTNKLKFSGSAYKHLTNASLHHGTILFDININKLSKYLTPNNLKLKSKGITSVTSRVVNLKELNSSITYQNLVDGIIEEFQQNYDYPTKSLNKTVLNENSTIFQEPKIKEHFDKLSDWNWIYGKSPHFTHKTEKQFDWGLFNIYYDVKRGYISSFDIYTDCLYPDLIDKLKNSLQGIPYTRESFSEALNFPIETNLEVYFNQFKSWLINELFN